MNIKFFSFIILFVAIAYYSVNAQEKNLNRYKGVNVGSETRTFTSKVNGVSYKLLINLPANYQQNKEKQYPVFYVLDGQWAFVNVVSVYGDLHWDGMVPDLIIVGLTWDGDDPAYGTLRTLDYTPPAPGVPAGSGGADAFIEVLRKEIIPFVDNEYRTNKKDRAITGTSFGGLFTFYQMFKAPELFNGYLPINPALGWANGKCYDVENEFAQKKTALPVRLCAISGERDAVDNFKKLTDQIESRGYKGLVMENRILEGMGHSGSKAEGHARGMMFIYDRSPVQLSDAELQQYTGTYEMGENLRFQMVENNGELLLKIPQNLGMQDLRIFAVGKDDFSIGTHHECKFLRDGQGKVVALRVEFPGNQIHEVRKLE